MMVVSIRTGAGAPAILDHRALTAARRTGRRRHEPILCPALSDVNTGAVDLVFAGRLIEWRGPAPYYFVPVPDEESENIREVAAMATYGWGVIPVEARIGEIAFTTSLFPKDGGYLLPLKNAVRKPHGLTAGDSVTVEMTVRIDL
jgi:hypothetical protein